MLPSLLGLNRTKPSPLSSMMAHDLKPEQFYHQDSLTPSVAILLSLKSENLILSEIDGEFLNNEDTWINYFLQNTLPEKVSVIVIPPENATSTLMSRHRAPGVVRALEKQAGYAFAHQK